MVKGIATLILFLLLFLVGRALLSPSSEEINSSDNSQLMEEDLNPREVKPSPDTPPAALVQEIKETVAKPTPSMDDRNQSAMNAIYGKFATGDFVGALNLADKTLHDKSYDNTLHQWVIAQLPALLTSAGWSLLKLDNCPEAKPILLRSDALKRTDANAKGLAVCYYREKNFLPAADYFQFLVDNNHADDQMLLMFADTLESLGQANQAVPILKKIDQKKFTEEDQKGIQQRIVAMEAKSSESDLQVVEQTRNFVITYRAGEHEPLITFVVEVLERALDEFIDQYEFPAPNSHIEVVLYSQESFSEVVPFGPSWAEGLFDGRMRIPVKSTYMNSSQQPILREILRHELVHALFSLKSGARPLPSWIDEGVAQSLACKPQCKSFSFPPTPGTFAGKETLTARYTSFDAITAGRAYRQSFYLIQFLTNQSEDSIRSIVNSVNTKSELTSDFLLRETEYSFTDLLDEAGKAWDKRNTFGGNIP